MSARKRQPKPKTPVFESRRQRFQYHERMAQELSEQVLTESEGAVKDGLRDWAQYHALMALMYGATS